MKKIISLRKMYFRNKLITLLALLILSNFVLADTSRIKWYSNQHYYQRIDYSKFTGEDAVGLCRQLGGYLASISSKAENNFIYKTFGSGFWLGANSVYNNPDFQWVDVDFVGNQFPYVNFPSNIILEGNGQHHLVKVNGVIASFSFLAMNSDGLWTIGGSKRSFLCEWNPVHIKYETSQTLPDINGNGSVEIASLLVAIDGKHTVKIRDSLTQSTLNTLTFEQSPVEPRLAIKNAFTPVNPTYPAGIVTLNDLNNNHMPEIGVLYRDIKTGRPIVSIKDTKSNGLPAKTIAFLNSKFNPKAVNSSPDSNDNGSTEITVLGINKITGEGKSETRDSLSGELLDTTAF